MREVFADTFYWVAIANPNDEWHSKAIELSKSLGQTRIVTSDEVLIEFLTQLGSYGQPLRTKAAQLVRSIFQNPNTRVMPQTRNSFNVGLKLYEERPDKEYSLTDCISMTAMKNEKLSDVLTHDKHFTQEGFNALFRD